MPRSFRSFAGEPGGLLLAERVVLRDLERLGQRAVVLAAVVALAGRRRVGEGVGRDEVLPPHRLGRHAELLGGDVDDALDVVAALGPAGAAVGGHRRRVGEDAGRAEVDVGDPVDADAHHERQVGDEREDRVGADVGEDVHPEPGDGAVLLDRRLHVGHVGAAVRRRHHVLDAGLDPPERQAVELAPSPPARRPPGRRRTSRRTRRRPRARSRGSGSARARGGWRARSASRGAPGSWPRRRGRRWSNRARPAWRAPPSARRRGAG